MRRVKYLFVFGIIIGLLFIGGNILKGNNIPFDKKDYNTPNNISDDFYGDIQVYSGLFNYNEDGDPLSNTRFKVSTWNNQYSFYSVNEGSGAYGFNNHRELSFDQMWGLLTDSQKQKVDGINTFGDFYNVFKDNAENPFGGFSYCYKNEDGYAYCSGFIGSYSILEQVNVPNEYTKQKYIVPSVIAFEYQIDDASSYDVGDISNVPNNTSLSLVGMYYIFDFNGFYPLKYGDYNELFNMTSFEDFIGLIDENIAYTEEECMIPPVYLLGPMGNSVGNSNIDRFKNTVKETYAFPYYYDCPPIVINKKGSINLSINTTVNEKESLNTTSNSKLVYKININNRSVTSYDNKIVSKLPDGFQYVNGSASNNGVYNPNDNTVTWTVYRIDGNSTLTLSYEAYAPNGLSGLKNYESEATIEAYGLQNKIVSNKAIVRLMANPKTNAPLYGIAITLLIVWGVALYLYIDHKRKFVKE